MTRLGATFTGLGDRLARFEDENGRVLYDLPDAPRPDPDAPAPIRFLPDYDNVLLGYADRSRIVSDADQKRLGALTRSFRAVLVDGFVAASWSLAREKGGARLVITPFRPLLKREARELEREGAAFLEFMLEGATGVVEVSATAS